MTREMVELTGKILTVSFNGKMTLPRDMLDHLGVRPGGQVWVDFVAPHGLLFRSAENVTPAVAKPASVKQQVTVLKQARRVFGSAAKAQAFMVKPHPELENRSPAESAETAGGATKVFAILNAIERGRT